jgi:heme A synthase
MTLIACMALTAWWGGGRPGVRLRGPQARPVAISLALVLLLGVTGAIAALGDTLFPAKSLSEGFAAELDPSSNLFVRLRVFHPMLAVLTAAWLVFFGVTSPRAALPYSRWMLGLLAAQIAMGILNWVLLAPVWAQIVHLLLADLVWISLVLVCAVRLGEGAVQKVGHA